MANVFPFEPRCLPLAPFDLPYSDEASGWQAQRRWTPRFMSLPFTGADATLQLAASGFPGRGTGNYIEDDEFERVLEHHQLAYLNDDVHHASVPNFERLLERAPWRQEDVPTVQMAIVGVYGAISTGLLLVDEQERPLFASAAGREAIQQHSYLRLRWLEHTLTNVVSHFGLCIVEPFWDATDLPFANYSSDEALDVIRDMSRVINVPLGLAPRGRVNWMQLLASPLRLLICPLAQWQSVLECGKLVNEYFDRGGVIAWSLVPSDPEQLTSCDVNAILRDWEHLLNVALEYDVLNSKILNGSLLTIEAGLGYQTPQVADQALDLLSHTSHKIRLKYKV